MHLFPRIDKELKLIAQSLVVLMDPLLHNQNMTSRTPTTKSGASGSKKQLVLESGHGYINMMLVVHFVTHSCDYGPSQPTMGKEPLPPKIPL